MTRGLWVGVIAAVLALSCSRRDFALFMPSTYFPEEKSVTPDTSHLPNTSPSNVLENLKLSYNRKNFRLYESLLADDYRFYMSETYQGTFNLPSAAPPDPQDWTQESVVDSIGTRFIYYYKTKVQDLNGIRNMFDPSRGARDIQLQFQATVEDTSQPDSAFFLIRNIDLRITLSNYQVLLASDRGSLAQTRVIMTREGDALWRIARWYDNTYGEKDAQ